MSELVDDLRRLDEALGSFPDDGSDLPGVRLMRESLARRREQILDAMVDQGLYVALERPARLGTGAELKLVAGVLASLQDSLSAIAQTLTGRPTTRGLIPSDIVESVELRVAAAAPGSLKLSLVPAFPETQEPLFEDGEESALDLSVRRLVDVLGSEQPEHVLSAIADLGPRATTHIQTLTKTLVDASADLTLAWQSPRGTADLSVRSVAAARLREVMSSVEEFSRAVVFTGHLVGGSLVRGTFELELEDGSVLRGTVDPVVVPLLVERFGRACTARVEIRELRLPTGETKEEHRLSALNP